MDACVCGSHNLPCTFLAQSFTAQTCLLDLCGFANSLSSSQAHFQRDRDQMSREEEEEYEQACEDSMFRIHILDKRLKRHEEAALQSYYELDNKLRHDPRLAVLTL